MSHRALGPQFGEQLQLFMSTDELIEKVNKGDSSLGKEATPREQWEAPGGADTYGGRWKGQPLAAKKQADLEPGGSHHRHFSRGFDRMEPIMIQHGRLGKDRPTLSEGHHRLAWAQMHGISHLPVEHAMPSESWVEMKNYMSEKKKEPPPAPDVYPPIKVYRLSSGGTKRTDYLIH